MVYRVNLVDTKCLNVKLLIEIGLGAGEVVAIRVNWRHKGSWGRHPEITIRGGQTERCTVVQYW